MMNVKICSGLIGAILALSMAGPERAEAAFLLVDARSDIFGAGHPNPPSAAGGGGGILPPAFGFAPGPGQVLTFSSVTGTVIADTMPPRANGPDGGTYAGHVGTNISPLAGISGIVHADTNFFLVGVFLDASEPADPAPARLSFSAPEDFTSLAPQLRQTFFIGDGRTSKGVVQQFLVPASASRLYLGFADSADPVPFQGRPGFYDDNTGSLGAMFTIDAVPEPSSLAQCGLPALFGLGVWARLRRSLICRADHPPSPSPPSPPEDGPG